MGRKTDVKKLIGNKYNKLTIISDSEVKRRPRQVVVRCDCGKIKETELSALIRGRRISCGCEGIKKAKENAKHGLWEHPIYRVWIGMKIRCYRPKCKAYKYYGGKGVKVCDEWIDNFQAFYDWAKNKWQKGLQLDKDIIPKKLGIPALLYSPEMCCFVTSKRNIQAQDKVRWYTINGQTKTISDWCEVYKINPATVYDRLLKKNMSIEKALTMKIGKGGGGKPFKVTKEILEEIFKLKNEGLNGFRISKKIPVTLSTIYRVLKHPELYDPTFLK